MVEIGHPAEKRLQIRSPSTINFKPQAAPKLSQPKDHNVIQVSPVNPKSPFKPQKPYEP